MALTSWNILPIAATIPFVFRKVILGKQNWSSFATLFDAEGLALIAQKTVYEVIFQRLLQRYVRIRSSKLTKARRGPFFCENQPGDAQRHAVLP